MIGYAVIVAVQIVLMGVLLGLVVFCKRKEGQEENTGLIIVVSLYTRLQHVCMYILMSHI